MIIGWLAAEGHARPILQRIVVCCLVCHAWKSRARFHLDCDFTCQNAELLRGDMGVPRRTFLSR